MIATAASQRWEHAEVLRVLLAEEAAGRDQATIRMRRRASGLPAGKTLDAWDEQGERDPQPDPTRRSAHLSGSSGRRTSASADRLGPGSRTRSRRSGTWRSTRARPSPGTRSSRSLSSCAATAPTTRSPTQAINRLVRVDLIIVDDVGLLPVAQDAAEALFRIVDAAYERRSLAPTSNLHPAGFDELMPGTLATGTVDRLLHHAHVLIADGVESYRLAQAAAGKGVMPLA